MVKKPPNSKKTIQYGKIAVSADIAQKLEKIAKDEAAVALNKKFRRERSEAKWKRHNAHVKLSTRYKPPLAEPSTLGSQYLKMCADDKVKKQPSEIPQGTISAGFNQQSREWHHAAKTGVTGKYPKRIPRSDHRYTVHPYVPKSDK